MAQSSGRSVEVLYLLEKTTPGVPEFTDGAINTTLTTRIQPGSLSFDVTSAAGIVDAMVLKVGSIVNLEYYIVDGAPAGNTVTVKSTTTPENLHLVGEAVVDVTDSDTAAWKKPLSIRSIEPSGERDIQQSQALTGKPVLSNFRPGNYSNSLSITSELGIDNSGLWLLAAMDNNYNTDGVSQTNADDLDEVGGTLVGDTTFETTGSATYTAGDFVVINSGGANEEVVKCLTHVGNTFTIDTAAVDGNPNGLRFAHVDAEVTDEVLAPFTHTIKTGSNILEGVTFVTRFTDNDFAVLARGARCGTTTYDFTTGDLPTITMEWQARATQVFGENIFGTTPTSLAHTNYVHWEEVTSIDGTDLATNFFESLTLTKTVELEANPIIGSPFVGAITPGDSSFGGNMTSQLEDLSFSQRVANGIEVRSRFLVTYSVDLNHSIDFDFQKSIYTGNKNPTATDRGPITQDLTFLSALDTPTDTDGIIRYINTSPTLNIGI